MESPMGPGFESQVPQYICCYFLSGISVSLALCNVSCTFIQRLPDGLQAKSDGLVGRSIIHSSQHTCGESTKSTEASACWATNLLFSPSNLGPNPLSISNSFLFYFIYLHCLFNYFHYYFLINQSHLFLIKSKTKKYTLFIKIKFIILFL